MEETRGEIKKKKKPGDQTELEEEETNVREMVEMLEQAGGRGR